MQKVFFQDDAELMYCCDVLFQFEKRIECTWSKVPYWGNVLLFKKEDIDMETLLHSFVMVYMTFRLGRRIRTIAEETYYYANETELQAIYESTMAILQDQMIQVKLFTAQKTLADIVFDLFVNQLSSIDDIHFDALVLFSIKPLDSYLIQAVGFGIDEMKREEAYQQFIANARTFVHKRTAQIDELHIVSGKELSFYQHDGTRYSIESLQEVMRMTPLYMIQLHAEEYELSPVIALAPKRIYYYSEQPYEGKVNTLRSIFLEKVYLYSIQQFPFTHQVK